MLQMPRDIEVHVIDSAADPVGCGEMGIPTAAPALANAIFAASGVRIRNLPMRKQLAEALKEARAVTKGSDPFSGHHGLHSQTVR